MKTGSLHGHYQGAKRVLNWSRKGHPFLVNISLELVVDMVVSTVSLLIRDRSQTMCSDRVLRLMLVHSVSFSYSLADI